MVVDETGALNVFDRGYNDYKKFDEYSEKGILFVTRLKSNAIIEYVADNPVNPEQRHRQRPDCAPRHRRQSDAT